MSIHFISGKPGGGKSLYGLKLIVEELVLGKRAIFTNIPLNVPALNVYLQERYPGASVDIFRIRILADEEVALFWTFRPGAVRIPRLTKEQWVRGELPSYAGASDGGVMYVIDEVHNFFGARQWAQTGQDVLFYLSQHRKLSDTVICITQAIGNVDKQFRSVTQDFTFLRNLSKESYGRFRLPGIFVRKTFSSPPTDTAQPMETGTFRLDVSGLASCYDSAQGVGIHGRSADKGEVGKGLSMWWYFVLVAVAAVVIFGVVPRVVAGVFTRPLRALPVVGVVGSSKVGTSAVVSRSEYQMPSQNVVFAPPVVTPPVERELKAVVREMTGFVKLDRGYLILLSDGETVSTAEPGRVSFLCARYVVLDGLTNYMRRVVGSSSVERPGYSGVAGSEAMVPGSKALSREWLDRSRAARESAF